MGYGVIGSPTGSGPVSLGSSPGTPATLPTTRMPQQAASAFVLPGRRRRLDLAATATVAAPARLQPGHAQQHQQDDGADDRPEQPGEVELAHGQGVVLDQVRHEPADERPHHTKDDGAEQADGVTAGNYQAGDSARDEADDQQNDNERQHACVNYPATAKHAKDLDPGRRQDARPSWSAGGGVWRRSARYASLSSRLGLAPQSVFCSRLGPQDRV